MLILEVRMNIEQVNAYMAEKCGITKTNAYGFPMYESGAHLLEMFDIRDPRCREIVREKFGVSTIKHNDQFECYVDNGTGALLRNSGKTIADAEIACITAIAESDNGD